MRWQFGDTSDPEFRANRELYLAKIEAWWNEFKRAADSIDGTFSSNSTIDIVAWMHEHLHAVHPQLMWEYGPAVKGPGHRLVITPESSRHLRPLTSSLMKRAPKLDRWEFYEYRLPEDVGMAHQTIRVRADFDSSEFKVRIQRNELNRIDLCYFAPNIAGADDRHALNAAFVATETLLGEERLDKWVGNIEVCPLKRPSVVASLLRLGNSGPKHLIPLERMKDTFDSVINSIREQLPPEPHYKRTENAQWSVCELTPIQAADYPQQLDLIASVFIDPAMWSAAHSHGNFYSGRYSQCGETFCYVKIDGADGFEDSKFADRSEIEDALTEQLTRHKLGCHIGGGTGLRYSYVDLAVVDLPRGIQAVRQILQAGRVSNRSWIQFHDSDLIAEWIGVYDDSPEPPMPNFDV
jgi:hypothetical protein